MWVRGTAWDSLNTRLDSLERLVGRLEDRMATWPVQMNDLAEKANNAVRRLAQREKRARESEETVHTDAPRDEISERIRQRRSGKRAVSR